VSHQSHRYYLPARHLVNHVPADSLPIIRDILNEDRTWSLYALGDLAPAEAAYCEWRFRQNHSSAVTLFYRAFDPPVFFASGTAAAVDALLDQAPLPQSLYLHIKPELVGIVSNRYRQVTTKMMLRMILETSALVDPAGVETLGVNDLNDLVELYGFRSASEKDGTFFLPAQVAEGMYFGIRAHGRLVAVAGTHLVNRAESAAAIGNVFCLSEYRGRGFGARVTSAVANALVKEGIETIGLNVGPDNPAVNLYRRLGFRDVCSYVEGTATRARS
jgi:ribosomal protein S18 acetylase RimI-like enzyme